MPMRTFASPHCGRWRSGDVTDEAARGIIAAWPKFDDDFQRSAAVGAASRNPPAAIAAALDSARSRRSTPFVSAACANGSPRKASDAAAKLVIVLAGKPASADPLKRSILDTLGKSLKEAPAMTPELSAALGKLLASGASGSVAAARREVGQGRRARRARLRS